MKNGRDEHYDDPKIASLSAARKKAAAGKKAAGVDVPRRSLKELLFGALVVAMAAGMLVHWTQPLWQSAVSLGK